MESRPPSFEEAAIQALVDLVAEDKTNIEPGFKLHIAHLSSATGIPIIEAARVKGTLVISLPRSCASSSWPAFKNKYF